MTRGLQQIQERQLAWASRCEIDVTASGHVLEPEAGLFQALTGEAALELSRIGHDPLGDGDKPGELQLLASTVALVCNAFDPVREDPGPVAKALGGDAAATRLQLYAQVGAAEVDVLLDVSLDTPLDGRATRAVRPTAVVASYAEPYRSARPERAPANCIPAEWLEDQAMWSAVPACKSLAFDLRATPRRYEHLGVARLLQCAVSLTQRLGYRGFRLVHLWHEARNREGTAYRSELDRFRARVGGEIDFHSCTWRDFLSRLSLERDDDDRHLIYLRDRYSLAEAAR